MIDFLSQSTNQNSCKSRIRKGKWEFADATFTRALLSLQVTPADRIKRSLLRGLMPCKMGAETPWIPWLPSFLRIPVRYTHVTSRDVYIFSTWTREYPTIVLWFAVSWPAQGELHYCSVYREWSQTSYTSNRTTK
jgi:hypothetical protein